MLIIFFWGLRIKVTTRKEHKVIKVQLRLISQQNGGDAQKLYHVFLEKGGGVNKDQRTEQKGQSAISGSGEKIKMSKRDMAPSRLGTVDSRLLKVEDRKSPIIGECSIYKYSGTTNYRRFCILHFLRSARQRFCLNYI